MRNRAVFGGILLAACFGVLAVPAARAAVPGQPPPSQDIAPPVITDMVPADGSFVPTAAPAMSARYHDNLSGVNAASVRIKVDGVDVTAQATVTASRVDYTPAVPLAADIQHELQVTVSDMKGNTASKTSRFDLDLTFPVVGSLVPAEGAVLGDATPTITGAYSDAGSGIDVSSVILTLDGNDVTAQAAVTVSSVSFTPSAALAGGPHTMTLSAADRAGNRTTAQASWTLDLSAPQVSVVEPATGTTAGNATPLMHVAYSDPSGVNLFNLVILLDGADITSRFTRTENAAFYTPAMADALAEGSHTLVARILDTFGNEGVAQSIFSVLTGGTDSLVPAVSIVFPRATPQNPDIQAFEGTSWRVVVDARDPGPSASGIDHLEFLVDGVEVSLDNTFPYETTVAFPDGIAGETRTLTAIAQDVAGNRATSGAAVIHFTTRPATGAVSFRVSGGPATVQAGQPFPGPVTFEATDLAGQVDPNYVGTARLFTSDPASAINTGAGVTVTFTAADQGVKQVDLGALLSGSPPLLTAGIQVIAVADVANPARDQGVMAVEVLVGPPAFFAISSGADQDFRGTDLPAEPIEARVTDAFGNDVPGIPVQLEIFEDGQLTHTLQAVTASLAVFVLPSIGPGTLTVEFLLSTPALPMNQPSFERIAQVVFFDVRITSPPDPFFLRAGDPFTLDVSVLDEFGIPLGQSHPGVSALVNLVQGHEFYRDPGEYPGSLRDIFDGGLPVSSGSFSGTTFFTLVNRPWEDHLSVFELSLPVADPQPLRKSIRLTVLPGPAVSLFQDIQNGNLLILVLDAFNNIVQGADLVFEIFDDDTGALVDTIRVFTNGYAASTPGLLDYYWYGGASFYSFNVILSGTGQRLDGLVLTPEDHEDPPVAFTPGPAFVNFPAGANGVPIPTLQRSFNLSGPQTFFVDTNVFAINDDSSSRANIPWSAAPTLTASNPQVQVTLETFTSQNARFRVTLPAGFLNFQLTLDGAVNVPAPAIGNVIVQFGDVFNGPFRRVGVVQRLGFTPGRGIALTPGTYHLRHFFPVEPLAWSNHSVSDDDANFLCAELLTVEAFAPETIPATVTSYARDGQVLHSWSTTLHDAGMNRYRTPQFFPASPELWENLGGTAPPTALTVFPAEAGGRIEVTASGLAGQVLMLGMEVELSTDGQTASYRPAPYGIFRIPSGAAPSLRYTPLGLGEPFTLYGVEGDTITLQGVGGVDYYFYQLQGVGDLAVLQSQGKLTVTSTQILIQPSLPPGARDLDAVITATVFTGGGPTYAASRERVPVAIYTDDTTDSQSGEVTVEGGWIQEVFDAGDKVHQINATNEFGEVEDQWVLERRLRLFFPVDDPTTPANESVSDEQISAVLLQEHLAPKGLDRDKGMVSVRSRNRALKESALTSLRDNPPSPSERAEFVHSIEFVRPRINGDGVQVLDTAAGKIVDPLQRVVPVNTAVVSEAIRRDALGQSGDRLEFLNPYRLHVQLAGNLDPGQIDTVQATFIKNTDGQTAAGDLVETAPDSGLFQGIIGGGSIQVRLRAEALDLGRLNGIAADVILATAFGIPYQGTKYLVESGIDSRLFKEEAGSVRITAGGPLTQGAVDSIGLVVTTFGGQQQAVTLTETGPATQVFTGAGAQAALYNLEGELDLADPVVTNPGGRDAFAAVFSVASLGLADEPVGLTETGIQSFIFENDPAPDSAIPMSPESGEPPDLTLLEGNIRDAQQFFVRAIEPGISSIGSVSVETIDGSGNVVAQDRVQVTDIGDSYFESVKPILAVTESPDQDFRNRYETAYAFVQDDDLRVVKGQERQLRREAKIVALGDSVTAGMNSLTLRKDFQPYAYPSDLGYRMGTKVKFPTYQLPGRPVSLWNTSLERYYARVATLLPPPTPTDRSNVGAAIQNMGVPGAVMRSVLESPPVPSPGLDQFPDFAAFFGQIWGTQDSAATQAVNQKPSLVTVWLGNNDALIPLLNAGQTQLTTVADFEQSFTNALSQLHSQNPMPDVVVVNVPDVTRIPILRRVTDPVGPLPYRIQAVYFGVIVRDLTDFFENSDIQVNGSVDPNSKYDLIRFSTQLVDELLSLPPEYTAQNDHHTVTFESTDVLTPAFLQTIQQRIESGNQAQPGYNEVINQVIQDHNQMIAQLNPRPNPVLIVDAHQIFEGFHAAGRFVGTPQSGKLLTTAYDGGVFSLDGVHPSMTVQAVIADEIVKRVKVAVEQQELPYKETSFGGFTLRQWLENVYAPAEYDRILRHDPRNR